MAAHLESYMNDNHINETHVLEDDNIISTWQCDKCTFINNESNYLTKYFSKYFDEKVIRDKTLTRFDQKYFTP